MLSAVIHSRLSYPALLLAEQLVHQRSVPEGPLVLFRDLLKNQRLQQIGDQPVSRMISLIAKCIGLYILSKSERSFFSLYKDIYIYISSRHCPAVVLETKFPKLRLGSTDDYDFFFATPCEVWRDRRDLIGFLADAIHNCV
jgi:hypothetical protein